MKQNYSLSIEDILRSNDEGLLMQMLNSWELPENEHIPFNPGFLNQATLREITKGLPQYPLIVAQWMGVVGANGHSVHVRVTDTNSEITRTKKQRLKDNTYRFVYTKQKWSSVRKQIIELIAREGNAIVRLNDFDQPIVESRFNYNIYIDKKNGRNRYAYKRAGQEVEGLKDLYHGEHIWHYKHPSFENWPIAPSPIDSVYMYILLENHGVQANQKLFDHGMVGVVLLNFEESMKKHIDEKSKDKNGKTWFQRMMDKVNDLYAGAKKAFRVGYVPGLKEAIELGKNNREVQFYELMKELTPERIAWGFLMVMSNFGSGANLTENNASTFDDALYDKFGRHQEEAEDECLNEWLLPYFGFRTSESFYIKYDKPKDPKQLERDKFSLEELKSNAITVNEYREQVGKDTRADGDQFLFELVGVQTKTDKQEVDNKVTDVEVVQPKKGYREAELGFFAQARDYRATTVDKVLDSDEYNGKKGILTKLKKAIKKQIEDYSTELESMESVPETIKLKPLETYYSFPAMKSDMLKVASIALDSVKKDKRTTFSMKKSYDDDFDGEYPQSILDFIDAQISRILKGDKEFKSVDAATSSQIETIVMNNISAGVAQVAGKILESVDIISFNRAELIASTEVVEAVEGTREIMYTTDPIFKDGKKKWQTSVFDVCSICLGNESQGLIDIDKSFTSGQTRPSAHPRDRCESVYYTADEAESES